jgi:hypothetical protein
MSIEAFHITVWLSESKAFSLDRRGRTPFPREKEAFLCVPLWKREARRV